MTQMPLPKKKKTPLLLPQLPTRPPPQRWAAAGCCAS